jgi:hypothetical protein
MVDMAAAILEVEATATGGEQTLRQIVNQDSPANFKFTHPFSLFSSFVFRNEIRRWM